MYNSTNERLAAIERDLQALRRASQRLAVIEKELQELRRTSVSKFYMEELKYSIVVRVLFGATVLQGIIAAAGAWYILENIGPVLARQILEALEEIIQSIFN